MIVIEQAGSDAAATIQTCAVSDSSIVLWFAPRKSVATATPFQQDCLSGGHRQQATQHSRFPYILVPPDRLQWHGSRSYVYHRYKLSWLQCGAKYFWQPVAPFSVALRRTLLYCIILMQSDR